MTGFRIPSTCSAALPSRPVRTTPSPGALSANLSPVGINLVSQIGAYSAFTSFHADPDALYVIMIGGNDVRDAALDGTARRR